MHFVLYPCDKHYYSILAVIKLTPNRRLKYQWSQMNCHKRTYDLSCRSVYGVGLQPHDCWDYGFESG